MVKTQIIVTLECKKTVNTFLQLVSILSINKLPQNITVAWDFVVLLHAVFQSC